MEKSVGVLLLLLFFKIRSSSPPELERRFLLSLSPSKAGLLIPQDKLIQSLTLPPANATQPCGLPFALHLPFSDGTACLMDLTLSTVACIRNYSNEVSGVTTVQARRESSPAFSKRFLHLSFAYIKSKLAS